MRESSWSRGVECAQALGSNDQKKLQPCDISLLDLLLGADYYPQIHDAQRGFVGRDLSRRSRYHVGINSVLHSTFVSTCRLG